MRAPQVERALVGEALGDVGQPDLVGGLSAELTLHEIVRVMLGEFDDLVDALTAEEQAAKLAAAEGE